YPVLYQQPWQILIQFALRGHCKPVLHIPTNIGEMVPRDMIPLRNLPPYKILLALSMLLILPHSSLQDHEDERPRAIANTTSEIIRTSRASNTSLELQSRLRTPTRQTRNAQQSFHLNNHELYTSPKGSLKEHSTESPGRGREEHSTESPGRGHKEQSTESPGRGREEQSTESPGRGREEHNTESPGRGREEQSTESPGRGREEQSTESPGRSHKEPSTLVFRSQTELIKSLVGNLELFSSKSTMFLCSHPPNDFSKFYLGDSMFLNTDKTCKPSDSTLSLKVRGAHELCSSIYFSLFDVQLEGHLKEKDGTRLWFYDDDDAIKLCVPLFERFQSCEFRDLYTRCGNVFFVRKRTCPVLSSRNMYVANHIYEYILSNKSECLEKLCDGTYTLIKSEISDLPFIQSCMLSTDTSELCDLIHNTKNAYLYNNEHWPCCYPYHNVLWYDDPAKHGLNGAWSFLPPWCRAAEIFLILMVLCVALGGSLGNLMVILVMVKLWHRNEESNMLRLNLALADLFTSVFTVWPSFYAHVKPFIEIVSQEENLTHVRVLLYSEEDHLVFQGIFFSSCTIVSLQTLFLLSFDRFVRTGRGLVYRHYITPLKVKVTIAFTWFVGIADALFMTHFMQKTGNVQWLPMLKLPIGSSNYFLDSVTYISCDIIQKLTMIISIPCTVGFSIMSIVNFLREQARVSAERRSFDTRILGSLREENRHILISQLLMTVSFLLATIPVGVYYIINNMLYDFLPGVAAFTGCNNNILTTYISWWLFVASTGWNPFIYNIQSAQFRTDLRETFQELMPHAVMRMFMPRRAEYNENRNRKLANRRRLLARVGITEVFESSITRSSDNRRLDSS
ncbi:uncharacterized protein LOC122262319, partial [Penaeus japonicus]|uniref:uncharacterized protein LOC122262319 n=1 Tax=Penaeus japonicus TaxID=27405 RepID=UPI001C70FF13